METFTVLYYVPGFNSNPVSVYCTLPALSAKNVMTWDFHVDESSKGRYYMILGRDLLTEIGLNNKKSDHVIKADDVPFIGATAPMVDLGTYLFKYLNTGKLNRKNCLLALTLKNYMNQNIYVLQLNDCLWFYMPNTKRHIYIRLSKLSVNI